MNNEEALGMQLNNLAPERTVQDNKVIQLLVNQKNAQVREFKNSNSASAFGYDAE